MATLPRWLRRFVTAAVACVLFSASAQPGLLSTPEGRELVFEALVDTFREHYWDPDYRDWDSWAQGYRAAALAAEGGTGFDLVAQHMVLALGDGHSNYLGRLADGAWAGTPEGPQPGLGFMHRYLPGSGLVVERVFPQTPAAQSGLERGDVIVRLNGRNLSELGRGNTLELLMREAIGAGAVELGVRRKFGDVDVTLTPAAFSFDYVRNLPQAEMLDDATGYLYIPTFNVPFVADEVHRHLDELQRRGARALVLDLRGNLGGRLGELGLVLGAFVEGPWARAVSHGDVVWQGSYYSDDGRGYNVLSSPDEAFKAEDVLEQPVWFDGPLAVLVSRENSSAGELAALVLQDMGRAQVVGEPTAGNVEAVRAFYLPGGNVVLVAVANLESISGRAFDGGVNPDVLARTELEELARGFDAPLAEALRVLKALPFTPGKFF